MAAMLFTSRRRQPALALSRCAIKTRDAQVLQHLPLADAIAAAAAQRLSPLVERHHLIRIALQQPPASMATSLHHAN